MASTDNLSIGIIGAGAWGTALAVLANRVGSRVKLWTRNRNVLVSVHEHRVNQVYLPGVFLHPAIEITDDVREVCRVQAVMITVPAQYVRSLCISMSDWLDASIPVAVTAKGIERGSLALMSEVIASVLPGNPVAILSGPNFADEVAQGLPAATVIASYQTEICEMLAYALGGKLFRPYMETDIIGAQIGGAVKNVVAIACGIAIGASLGDNARAALMTRGLAEMGRLCEAKGGRRETLMGLAGLGDLILTCTSAKSRNFSYGLELASQPEERRGLTRRGTVEGVATTESVVRLAQLLEVEMPICEAVHQVIFEQHPLHQAITRLLERPWPHQKVKDTA